MRELPDVARDRSKSISLSLRSFSEEFDWLTGYEDSDILENLDRIPRLKPLHVTCRKDLDQLINAEFVIKLDGVWLPARVDRKLQVYPVIDGFLSWVTIPDKNISYVAEINAIYF